MTIELGPNDFAKYPFLKETGEYITGLDIDVDELTRPEYHHVLERAKERILEAMQKQIVSEEFYDREKEILSFPLALILVRATKMDHIISRYAFAEAVRVENFLKSEKAKIIPLIFERVLEVHPARTNDNFTHLKLAYEIPLVEYLKRSVHFHTPSWRLVNKIVDNGSVLVTSSELVRLLREEIYGMISSKLRSSPSIKLRTDLRKAVDEIIKAAPPVPIKGRFFSGEYPPCVSKALELLESGQNVPHYGRFLMTTFLLHAGKNVDDVINMYPRSPDFNERITRYQVEHIAGLRGGRTEYSVPGCMTVQANNFCFKTRACGTIRNPLQFGRDKRRRFQENQGKRRGNVRRNTTSH